MNLVVWLVLGGLLGAAASMLVKGRTQHTAKRNLLVGIAGAVFGGVLLSLLFDGGSLLQQEPSMVSMLGSVIVGALLLAVVNLFNRGTAR